MDSSHTSRKGERKLSIILFIATIPVTAFFLLSGWVVVLDFTTAIASGIVLAMIGTAAALWYRSRSDKSSAESKQEDSVEQKAKEQAEIILDENELMKGVKLNTSRSKEALYDLIEEAQEEMYVLGIDCNSFASPNDLIQRTIEKKQKEGKRFVFHFLLLNPKSDFLDPKSKMYAEGTIISEESTKTIRNNLHMLCQKRQRLGDLRDQVRILQYDVPLLHTAVVIDPKLTTAKIQTEGFLFKVDTDLRPSLVVSKTEQKDLYEVFWQSFDHVLQKAEEYDCGKESK